MPGLYIGNPGGGFGGPIGPISRGPFSVGGDTGGGTGGGLAGTPTLPGMGFNPKTPPGRFPQLPTASGMPGQTTVPSNTLGAQGIRPSGPPSSFDPSYLQNLATAIGGLFSRPGGGNLSFNPLGDLSDISGPSLGFGNAPLPGLPNTMLQDAINGLAFMFNQPSAASGGGGGSSPIVGGGYGGNDNNGRGRMPILQ